MAISGTLKTFLDGAKVPYTVAKHPVVYTAQEIAAAQHVPGRQLAKCVLVKTGRGPVLAVLPATHLIDFKRLKSLLGGGPVSIAKEPDCKAAFPDVEVGAMSPFGNLYHVPVVVETSLAHAPDIVFNGGTHSETIKMRYQDFASLVKPAAGAFGQPIAPPAKPGARGKARRAQPTSTSKRAAKPKAARKARGAAKTSSRAARRPKARKR